MVRGRRGVNLAGAGMTTAVLGEVGRNWRRSCERAACATVTWTYGWTDFARDVVKKPFSRTA